MKISADAHFEKGSTHPICQDYACAGRVSDSHFAAVVCDGCSTAINSDVGARILAHAFLREAPGGPSGLRDRVATRLVRGLEDFGLPEEAGRATVVGWILDAQAGRACGYAWGDGYLAVGCESGVEAWIVRHPHNAPPYLGYWTSAAALKEYAAGPDFGMALEIEHVRPDDTRETLPADGWWEIELPVGDGPVSFVAGTDGAASVCGGGSVLPAMNAIREFTAYRDFEDGFVCRRLRRQLRLWGRRETPLLAADDVATAALRVDPEGPPR